MRTIHVTHNGKVHVVPGVDSLEWAKDGSLILRDSGQDRTLAAFSAADDLRFSVGREAVSS